MSCWVVPALAAEYLGTTVEELLSRVRLGTIPTRTENGFTFVDVAPHSRRWDEPEMRPPTFVELTAEELAALHEPAAAAEKPAVRADEAEVEREWSGVRRRIAAMRRRRAA
jgi:hypothetical protein